MIPRSYTPKRDDIERDWLVVDAEGITFGRLCTEVARLLTGKHKPTYARHMDTGDFVVIVNAEKVVLSGRKTEDKIYYRNRSQRPGGLKAETARELLARQPQKLVERGVKGMLPKNRLGRKQFKKLKVYTGPEHVHQAQQPKPWAVSERSSA
jgi:large subunit ribosomal protein L13